MIIVKVNEDLRTTEHRKVYRAKAMTKGHGAKQILEYASLYFVHIDPLKLHPLYPQYQTSFLSQVPF